MGWLRIVIVVIGLGVGVGLPSSASAGVLYRTPNVILASTVASGRLAWIEGKDPSACSHVYRRRAAGGRRVRMTKCRGFFGDSPWIQLLGTRVYWDAPEPNPPSDSVRSTVTLGHPREVGSWTIPCHPSGCTPNSHGRQLGPVAVGDRALFYTVFQWSFDASGNGSIVSGVVRRAVFPSPGGLAHFPVPGAPPAALFDQAAKRILEVPAVIPSSDVTPSSTLELRHDRSGKLGWSITFTGAARAVGLSAKDAVTLVQPPTGAPRLRAYATTTGVLIRSLAVRPGVLPEIGVSGPRIVFAYPHSIMLWNVRHNLLRRLGRSSFPGSLTISGDLVTWLQRTVSESTIHGVLLPPLQP